MRPSSSSEQLHVMSERSSGRSSLESPGPEGSSSVYSHWRSGDPRNSSSQSLAPTLGDNNGRRTLMVVYLHGFMGNDSSFRSFPAHVHSYLKEALQETHVVHTKIYPRYKTYKSIAVARDNFSRWLEPHESYTTDVVLVGHSMGGLLAADVVLMPGSHGSKFKHRIIGTISLDSPFLGLHPGIIVSGIASLFRPADKPSAEETFPASPEPLSPNTSDAVSPGFSQQSSFSQSSLLPGDTGSTTPTWVSHAGAGPSDPYFNPPFVNDVQFKDRGFLNNVIHFTKKHMDENLVSAAKNHIMAHLEFGSCLADYPGLNQRYNRIRQLEDVDVWKGRENPGYVEPTRVRFVNYFTISTGRVTKPQSPSLSPGRDASSLTTAATANSATTAPRQEVLNSKSGPLTPSISIEDPDGGQPKPLDLNSPMLEESSEQPPPYSLEQSCTTVTPSPTKNSAGPTSSAPSNGNSGNPDQATDPYAHLNLPTIPDAPSPPTPLDLSKYPDPSARKQAEKEYKSALKTYDQAVKTRDKALSERTKLIEKSKSRAEKDVAKETVRLAKETAKKEAQTAKDEQKRAKEEAKRLVKQTSGLEKQAAKEEAEKKKKKQRKFCMLPRKTNGERDSAWVEVYMEGVDEVGAHCGLFFAGPHYEKLVGDVGGRIVAWVQEDATRRTIDEMEAGVEAIRMVDLELD